MKQTILLVAVLTLLLLALPLLPAMSNPEGSATGLLGVAYADEVDPTPTPTPTPLPPNGSCQGSGQCGN